MISRLLRNATPRYVASGGLSALSLVDNAQIAKLFTPCCHCYCCRRDNYAAAQLNRTIISSFGIDRAPINGAFAGVTLASRTYMRINALTTNITFRLNCVNSRFMHARNLRSRASPSPEIIDEHKQRRGFIFSDVL